MNETKLDLSKPLQTVSGIKVELLATNGRGSYPLVGYTGNSHNVTTWTIDGIFHEVAPRMSDGRNLINVPETCYRPWTVSECPTLIEVRRKGYKTVGASACSRYVIVSVSSGGFVRLGADQTPTTLQSLFDDWEKTDGTPCGFKIS